MMRTYYPPPTLTTCGVSKFSLQHAGIEKTARHYSAAGIISLVNTTVLVPPIIPFLFLGQDLVEGLSGSQHKQANIGLLIARF